MMNAIVPLNIAALRVNNNDSTNVVSGLQGKTAAFSAMPWYNPNTGAPPAAASTGDKIYFPLGTINGMPLNSPAHPLGVGVHLQWALPDYFRKGVTPPEGGNPIFPAAPNRWLVTRFLSFFDPHSNTYGNITSKSWVVESDYLASTLAPDQYGIIRPTISVPVPATPRFQQQPYMYMGRVLEASAWNPANEAAANYLPFYKGSDGKPLYLTSIGFVGAYFGAYYPECCSVFGFWDNFTDVPFAGYSSLYAALEANVAIQFRTSYQVSGWLNEGSLVDPLADIDAQVTDQYNDYLSQCLGNQVAPERNPNDFFQQITADKMKWCFNMSDLSYTLNQDLTIASLHYPQTTLTSGTTQEVVWNMLGNPGTTYFLKSNTLTNVSVWNSRVAIAAGNSMEEAVAAMLKTELGQTSDDPNVLTNYEYLLDALQLGLLAGLENTPNKLITLEEALHGNGFSTLAGGYLWIVGSKEVDSSAAPNPNAEVTLPLRLAEQLHLLNQAQKNYDMGRAALGTMRSQLFMDWTHYVKMYTGEINDPNISLSAMAAFLTTNTGGELNAVIAKGDQVGMLAYITDPDSGAVIGIAQPVAGVAVNSLAYAVWNNYNLVQQTVADYAAWQLQCAQSENFYQPNEPVLLMQGDMMEPVIRNGNQDLTFVRLSQEILSQLGITYNNTKFSIPVTAIAGVPGINSLIPVQADVQALTGEAYLITPMLASAVAAALAAMPGANNPAQLAPADFIASLMLAQGGLSPLEIAPNPGGLPISSGLSLFATVNDGSYQAAANPDIQVSAPQALDIVFSNAASNGWPPNCIGWTAQATPSGFPASQVNPFLPVFMIWNVRLNPLLWENQSNSSNPQYSATNITDFFALDTDAVDYAYKMNGGQALDFTSPASVTYGNSAVMNSNSTGVLAYQIQSFIDNHPGDPDTATLQSIAQMVAGKKFLAQAISGFDLEQILGSFVAQVTLDDLTKGPRDNVTTAIANAAVSHAWDNWYDFGFNSQEPISTGLLAQGNFGPLRSGFLEILSVEIIDAFGQRMDLTTANTGALDVITAYSMKPPANDSANQGKIYLPPRILAPTRLWFQWLSAAFNTDVPGITGDFEEMSQHPATSPVCGWVLPNHLDNNLFFYDAQGTPIGSFGIEHLASNPSLVYRTRAGNLANPTNNLGMDIGAPGNPSVNPNLANYMWYLAAQNAGYLQDMMTVILDSSNFINPSNYAQAACLSVLIGRPLALTRVVVGLETAGNLLPLSQADNSPASAFPQDVNNQRVNYADRMATSSANLQQVNFPLRMGDLANLDDGLVGYLMEGNGANPYSGTTFYAPAASAAMQHGVQQPTESTLLLTLNAAPIRLTMLVDPRAAVHATTAVLPTNALSIPPDQYSTAMNNLAVNFIARPMLNMAQGLVVPLPAESGYVWSWITPGAANTIALAANAVTETPAYGYSPQTLQEGWLELTPTAETADQG